MNDFYLNCNSTSISSGMILLLLMRSGLQWEMHPAQVYALEKQAFDEAENVTTEITVGPLELGPKTKYTLMGIPIIVREDYPMALVRLMYEGKEVTRMEALAIPSGFCNYADFDDFWKKEREKFEKIGFRSTLRAVPPKEAQNE